MEIKRGNIYYETNGEIRSTIDEVLSFKGYVTYDDGDSDTILGFYNFRNNCYYFFYNPEDYRSELWLNELPVIPLGTELSEFERIIGDAIKENFILSEVREDYKLVRREED